MLFYVYLIRSINFPKKVYTGVTQDLEQRLKTHNAGGSAHTAKFKPWDVVTVIGFKQETAVRRFEEYLKSASGRAFAHKHFFFQ